MDQGDPGFCQRLQDVEGIPGIEQRFGFIGEAIIIDERFPVVGLPLLWPLPPGQLLKSQTGASP